MQLVVVADYQKERHWCPVAHFLFMVIRVSSFFSFLGSLGWQSKEEVSSPRFYHAAIQMYEPKIKTSNTLLNGFFLSNF